VKKWPKKKKLSLVRGKDHILDREKKLHLEKFCEQRIRERKGFFEPWKKNAMLHFSATVVVAG